MDISIHRVSGFNAKQCSGEHKDVVYFDIKSSSIFRGNGKDTFALFFDNAELAGIFAAAINAVNSQFPSPLPSNGAGDTTAASAGSVSYPAKPAPDDPATGNGACGLHPGPIDATETDGSERSAACEQVQGWGHG